MEYHTPLITTIVFGLVLATILGGIATKLRISPLVGYLLAGVFIGPFTPGMVADQGLATELAEIGVILLMFGVGLHFSMNDLLSVRAIALPGAIAQFVIATLLGIALAISLGWTFTAGIVFGLSLSVASTVVTMRAFQDRRMIGSEEGRIAMGWLIIQDLFMIFALVLLPALADIIKPMPGFGPAEYHGPGEILGILGLTFGKIIAFFCVMLIVGRRVIPWTLQYAAQTGSREMFRLTVLAIALGVAYGSAVLFDVSFALGAFFAGMILSESELSQQAAEESLPLRDAFAVLFFVSVGMLFNPTILLENPLTVLTTLLIIILGKSIASFIVVMAFRHPLPAAITISASLAQIGEFSFILAALGLSLGLLNNEQRDLILAGAILSIFLNPLVFAIAYKIIRNIERRYNLGLQGSGKHKSDPHENLPLAKLRHHAVVVGFGRVGHLVAEKILHENHPIIVIEERPDIVEQLRARGIEALYGNASTPEVLKAANIAEAKWLFVAMPNVFEAGQILDQARAANKNIDIITRAHSNAEVEYLRRHGAHHIVMGEQEIAKAMLGQVFGSKSLA
jgi:monovalent cation:H+ antiporter-2, CPA2 family